MFVFRASPIASPPFRPMLLFQRLQKEANKQNHHRIENKSSLRWRLIGWGVWEDSLEFQQALVVLQAFAKSYGTRIPDVVLM